MKGKGHLLGLHWPEDCLTVLRNHPLVATIIQLSDVTRQTAPGGKHFRWTNKHNGGAHHSLEGRADIGSKTGPLAPMNISHPPHLLSKQQDGA